ncbi:MAG: hypothetical protein LKKZDAJK_000147 [Candidatus Fervidibacter sp.]
MPFTITLNGIVITVFASLWMKSGEHNFAKSASLTRTVWRRCWNFPSKPTAASTSEPKVVSGDGYR